MHEFYHKRFDVANSGNFFILTVIVINMRRRRNDPWEIFADSVMNRIVLVGKLFALALGIQLVPGSMLHTARIILWSLTGICLAFAVWKSCAEFNDLRNGRGDF
jgi:hypothetical protein